MESLSELSSKAKMSLYLALNIRPGSKCFVIIDSYFLHLFISLSLSLSHSLFRQWLRLNPEPQDDEASALPLCQLRWPNWAYYLKTEVILQKNKLERFSLVSIQWTVFYLNVSPCADTLSAVVRNTTLDCTGLQKLEERRREACQGQTH